EGPWPASRTRRMRTSTRPVRSPGHAKRKATACDVGSLGAAGPERAEPPAQAVPRRKAGSTNARSNRIPGARKDTGRALHVRTALFDPVEFTTEIFLQHTQVWEHALLERGREYGDQITRLSKSGQQHLEEGVQVDLSRLVAFPLLQRARERVLGCRPKRKGMPAFVGTSHGPPIREEPPD